MISGNPAASQCASALAAQPSSSGVRLITIRSSEPSSWSAVNSRSSVSRLASSAPSQRIAGPNRVSSARSGPIANGISTTTVRKNSTPISAPPPTRSAIRTSRANQGGKRGHDAPPIRIHPQFPGLDPERRVGGGDDQAAARKMVAHQRRTGPVLRHRAPRSVRPAARPAAAPLAAGRSKAAAVGRPIKTPPADARHDRARPRPGFRRGRSLPPRKSRQNDRFSRTLNAGFSASRWPR